MKKEKKRAVLPQLKGSVKEKKGCGKWYNRDQYRCEGETLCPSCKSKSVDTTNRNEADKPEEKCSSKVASPPSGDNSNTKTLSDKMEIICKGIERVEVFFWEEDVKDSITKLKEELRKHWLDSYDWEAEIDKIFGERLTTIQEGFMDGDKIL